MIKYPTSIALCVSTLIGIGLLYINSRVHNVEDELKKVHKAILKQKDAFHLLKAEWAHLNDPKRLQLLATKHLGMKPTQVVQLISLDHSQRSTKDVDFEEDHIRHMEYGGEK